VKKDEIRWKGFDDDPELIWHLRGAASAEIGLGATW